MGDEMCNCGLTAGCELCNPAQFSCADTEALSGHRKLLEQYLKELGAREINYVAGLYLVGFTDRLDRRGECKYGQDGG